MTTKERKWRLFAGRNKFNCDGLLMSSPQMGMFYLTLVLITGTSALFLAFDCPFLVSHVHASIPIVGVILCITTIIFLLRTTFTDPGIIPRASSQEEVTASRGKENALSKEVSIKGHLVKLPYCVTCEIFRSPRAAHCRVCNNCVERFDHHCPWAGNCVGIRNYRFFYMFLITLMLLISFIFLCSVLHLALLQKSESDIIEVIKMSPSTVVVIIICFASLFCVSGLVAFHTYLTASNQTTREYVKRPKSMRNSPNIFSRRNIFLNFIDVLCGPMTPSLLDRRGFITEEFVLQNSAQLRKEKNQVIATTPIPTTTTATVTRRSNGNGVGKTYLTSELNNLPSALNNVHGEGGDGPTSEKAEIESLQEVVIL